MTSSSRRSTISLVALAQLAWVAALALLLTPRWRVLRGVPSGVLALAVVSVLLAIYAAYTLVAVRRATRRLERGLAEERRLSATLEQDVTVRAAALEDARRVLQRMWWLGQQIALELDPQRVLERFLEAVVDIAQADGGVVALLGEGEMLRIVAGTGIGAGVVGHELPAGASIMGSVVRNGGFWATDDVAMYDREAHEATLALLRGLGVKGLAILPIARRGERIGAVAISSVAARSFTPRALEHVGAMSDLLSMALANAELVETLRRAEWRFRTLFRAAPDAVFTVLQSGRIREANDAVRDLTGLDPHQVVGRAVIELAAENDRERLRLALESAFAGSPERLEIVILSEVGRRATGGATGVEPSRSSQARRLVSFAISPLREADPPSVLVIGRDVTSEREMRARLMESDRLAAVGELVAGVAHEVNNPLSSISAFAQLLLRDGGLTPAQRESVDVIRSETMRASQVVKDLLAFARRSDPQRVPLDLNAVVTRTLRMRSYQLGAHNIHIEADLATDLPAVIGDARQLQQVCLNLVTNAIQAMATIGGGTLAVTTRADGPSVVLDMRDTGPGIAEDARKHVFEPFFTTKQEGEGTGLGLSVSYGIVRAHEGTIEVAETSSAGTTFRVTLPAADVAATEDQAAQRLSTLTPTAGAAIIARREGGAFALRSPLAGIRLLFVEADAALRSQLETYGALRGFTVVPVSDGRAALDMIRKTGVDAILCSVKVWDVDGVTLLEYLRRERPGLAPRMILLSEEGDAVAARPGVGASARQPRLTKPFAFERLEELLAATLRGGPALSRR